MPRRAAKSELPVIGEAAASLRIRSLDGHEHELRELWAKHPVALAFLRHFG